MRSKRLSTELRASLVVFTLTLFLMGASVSAQESVLFSFNNQDGNEPLAGLVSDASGNLYGTTFYGGAYAVGTVFELTPREIGWKETVLYNFNDIGNDGFFPNSRLVFDAAGNLYGTTFFGGDFEVGTVYKLSPSAGGGWTESIVHSFDANGGDGHYPHGGVLVDASGNVYGTTADGGSTNDGTVYKVTPAGGGAWTETVLHSFIGADGANPYSDLVMDGWGNLYGTTASGGSSSACTDGCGTVFEVSPTTGGGWTEKVLHSFNNTDGANPGDGVIFDNAGNLYGTAGGSTGTGPVFELTQTTSGDWKEKILYTFNSNGADGMNPTTLTFDAAGNLYGPVESGGAYNNGAIFELRKAAGGKWSQKLLHSFSPIEGNGAFPGPGLVLDSAGKVYGVTLMGGEPSQCRNGCGTVFEITP
jgi:uncharacterized repeat protein (TIGR03803 family)